MIEPKKRPGDMAVVPAGGVKRPRAELIAAAQSQQLVAMVRKEGGHIKIQGERFFRYFSFRKLLAMLCFQSFD